MLQAGRPFLANPLNRSRGLFFSLYGSAAMLFPFLAVYLEAQGLSGREIGLLAAIPPLVSILAAPVWGAAADATQGHRRLMRLALIGSILAALPLPFVSGLVGPGLLLGLHAAFFMSLAPSVDHAALEALGGRPENYGRLRFWGSVGWGLSGMLLAPVLARFGLTWIFFGHAAALLAGLLVAAGLPSGPTASSATGRPSSGGLSAARTAVGAMIAGFGVLLADRRWQICLLIIFTAGFGNAMVTHYQFLYLGSLSAGAALMGGTLAFGVISELVMLALADRLLRRFGTARMLLAGTALQAAQLLAWSFIGSPALAIAVYLLKGVAFGALWTAAVARAREITPPGMTGTAVGLLSSMYFGLSSAAGALIGGLGYELAGPAGLFRWTALGMLSVLLAIQLAGAQRARTTSRRTAGSVPC